MCMSLKVERDTGSWITSFIDVVQNMILYYIENSISYNKLFHSKTILSEVIVNFT